MKKAEEKKKKKAEEIKMFRQSLPCKLTDAETLTYSRELARTESLKIASEQEKKRVVDDFKAQMTKLEADIGHLSRTINNGYEYRLVEVYWTYHWFTGKKELIRPDTAEIVRTEAITDQDRQIDLDLQKKEEGERREEKKSADA